MSENVPSSVHCSKQCALAEWAEAASMTTAHATPHNFGDRKAFIAGTIDELIADSSLMIPKHCEDTCVRCSPS